MPSIFECINAQADANKALKWAAYTSLNARQLADKPSKRDPEQNQETVTLNAEAYGKFVVIKRPTEIAVQYPDKHRDKLVERRPTPELRWCIYCQERHPVSVFLHSPRYLHGLSYACKTSLRKAKTFPWKYAPGLLTVGI